MEDEVNLHVNSSEKNLQNNIKEGIKQKSRIWELDLLRGIALLLMIYFHIIFDMKDIFGYNVYYSKGFNYLTGRAAGILFILISGISCTLSKNNMKRALKILAIAMIITVLTHLYNVDMGIKFGILHFLGLSILTYPLLNNLNEYLLMMSGTVILILGGYVSRLNPGFDYLFIVGITSEKFTSSDYYPLIPWLGIFIYGIILGKVLYKDKRSIFNFQLRNNIISWLGRNTLPVYIIHQPVILAIIGLIKKITV
ncbi:MAG TPA: heparan-alpha-glucosaminide N-acetyltransferase [Clostridiales bacterium]|nr:heparan-alpha-glucosaminide N-acetyltransferase [Clostridiales bacterium]